VLNIILIGYIHIAALQDPLGLVQFDNAVLIIKPPVCTAIRICVRVVRNARGGPVP
jgi:hypothetical protein